MNEAQPNSDGKRIHATLSQSFRCKNDVNGNPRRLWLVYSAAGQVLDVFDEGYAGAPGWVRVLPTLPWVEISPTRYKQLLRFYTVKGA